MIFKHGDKVEVDPNSGYAERETLLWGSIYTVSHMTDGFVFLLDHPTDSGGWLPDRFKKIPPQTKDDTVTISVTEIKKGDRVVEDPTRNSEEELIVEVSREVFAYPAGSTGMATVNPGRPNAKRVHGIINYQGGFMWTTDTASGSSYKGYWDNFTPDWSIPNCVRELPNELQAIFGDEGDAVVETVNYVKSRLEEIIRKEER